MKKKGPPCSSNRERIEYDDLLRQLLELLLVYRGLIRVTILKNIALVTYALLTLFQWGAGRQRLALESSPGSMSTLGDRAQREGTATLSVLEESPFYS